MKYYRIKRGREDIYGRVIQVDPEAELEEKVKDFIENTKFYLVKHEHLKDFGEGSIAYYESDSPRRPRISISVDEEGNISLHIRDLKNIEVCLSEISEQEAERLRRSVHKWKQFQAWDME